MPTLGVIGNNGVSPWAKGQMFPLATFALNQGVDKFLDLTGVAANQVSLIIYNSSFVQTGTGAGSFSILQTSDPATKGLVQYAWTSADSAALGQQYLRVKVNFSGSTPYFSDWIPWLVEA